MKVKYYLIPLHEYINSIIINMAAKIRIVVQNVLGLESQPNILLLI